jgi:hypothetical protein
MPAFGLLEEFLEQKPLVEKGHAERQVNRHYWRWRLHRR